MRSFTIRASGSSGASVQRASSARTWSGTTCPSPSGHPSSVLPPSTSGPLMCHPASGPPVRRRTATPAAARSTSAMSKYVASRCRSSPAETSATPRARWPSQASAFPRRRRTSSRSRSIVPARFLLRLPMLPAYGVRTRRSRCRDAHSFDIRALKSAHLSEMCASWQRGRVRGGRGCGVGSAARVRRAPLRGGR